MFNPDTSHPAQKKLWANQLINSPFWEDDNEEQSIQPKTPQQAQVKRGKKQTLLTASTCVIVSHTN